MLIYEGLQLVVMLESVKRLCKNSTWYRFYNKDFIKSGPEFQQTVCKNIY